MEKQFLLGSDGGMDYLVVKTVGPLALGVKAAGFMLMKTGSKFLVNTKFRIRACTLNPEDTTTVTAIKAAFPNLPFKKLDDKRGSFELGVARTVSRIIKKPADLNPVIKKIAEDPTLYGSFFETLTKAGVTDLLHDEKTIADWLQGVILDIVEKMTVKTVDTTSIEQAVSSALESIFKGGDTATE